MIDEVGGRLRAASGCEIFGAGAGHDPDRSRCASQSWRWEHERPDSDRDIDAVLDGLQNPVAEQKAQGDIGIGFLEFAESGRR